MFKGIVNGLIEFQSPGTELFIANMYLTLFMKIVCSMPFLYFVMVFMYVALNVVYVILLDGNASAS